MIVKDEAHVIQKTLANLVKYLRLNYWVISDTGSTDTTKAIIRKFFKTHRIPGELIDTPWKDFGFNRSAVVEAAYNKTDYAFMFDADDEIRGDFRLPSSLKEDWYNLQYGEMIGDEIGVTYERPQLFNNRKRWHYMGVLHEYLFPIPGETVKNSVNLSGNYHIISGRTGNRNNDPDKYLKDAITLELAYYKTIKDVDRRLHSRYAYYCAQSYFAYGIIPKAIEYYKQTLALEGWLEEKYVSAYKLYDIMERKEDAISYLIDANNLSPRRIECVYRLVNYYLIKNQPEKSLEFYKLIQTTYETDFYTKGLTGKYLLVSMKDYKFLLPYDMIIVSERTKHYAIGIRMYEIILKYKSLQIEQFYITHLFHNLQFFYKKIKDPAFFQEMRLYVDQLRAHGLIIEDAVIAPYFEAQKLLEAPASLRKPILFYCGFSDTNWNETFVKEKGAGGTESCIVSLAKEFSKDSTVYVCGGGVAPEIKGDVHYRELSDLPILLETIEFHAIIISRYIGFLEEYPSFRTQKLIVWAHDINLLPYIRGSTIDIPSVLTKWRNRIDTIICLTDWHKQILQTTYPMIADKLVIIPNGIHASLECFPVQKRTNRFVFASRPERGYARMVELWPAILELCPDAELKLATYVRFPNTIEDERLLEQLKAYPSIEFMGCLNRKDLYNLFGTAEYWLYPTQYHETFCITALEMMLHKVICLYSPVAALVNTVGDYGIALCPGNEIGSIAEIVGNSERKEAMQADAYAYAQSFDWSHVGKQWMSQLQVHYTPPISVGILTHYAPNTLTHTLQTYKEKGLFDQTDDLFVVIQHSTRQMEEKKVCDLFGIRAVLLPDNGRMAWGFKAIYENAQHEYILFLENDFVINGTTTETNNFFKACRFFLTEGGADLVRGRSRSHPGEPNWAVHMYKSLSHESMMNHTHLSESIYWHDDPEKVFPTRITKLSIQGSGPWYSTTSQFCNYTNNPYVCSKEFFKRAILPSIEFGMNLETELTPLWSKQSYTCVFGPGLFTHDRSYDGHT